MSITQIDKQYVAGTYNRFPVEIVRGKGSECWDANGKRYIDMGSGIGVTAFGYADEAWQAAVTAQLGVLHRTQLGGDSGLPLLVGIAEGGDADTAAHIDVTFSRVIPTLTTPTVGNLHGEAVIGVRHVLLV